MPVDPVETATAIKLKKCKYLDKVTKYLAADDKVSVDLLDGANSIHTLEPLDVFSGHQGSLMHCVPL